MIYMPQHHLPLGLILKDRQVESFEKEDKFRLVPELQEWLTDTLGPRAYMKTWSGVMPWIGQKWIREDKPENPAVTRIVGEGQLEVKYVCATLHFMTRADWLVARMRWAD